MAYVKPIRPVIVIPADKAAEFESRKTNNELIEKIKRIAELSKRNNEKKL
ncbi:MAG: hypothetical protein IIX10_05835 [Clostridia bacterium]|nr:hypothetical protein [Clostridia bacterium]